MTCSTCVWSRVAILVDEDGVEPGMECWRYPPTMLLDEDGPLSIRPQVGETDMCGEYEEAAD